MVFRMQSWTPAFAGATGGANVNTSIKTGLSIAIEGYPKNLLVIEEMQGFTWVQKRTAT